MKRWYILLFAVILVGFGVYAWLHREDLGLVSPDGSSNSGASSAETARPARILWQKLDRTPDGFKVEMPTDSKEIQIPSYNAAGGSEQINMLYAYPDADTSFSVAWADNPPVARASDMAGEKTLDTAREDALTRTQSSLVSESKSSVQGFAARDFSGRNSGGGVFNARMILAGQRLYMLIASFPSTSARRDLDVKRFFDSFSVVGK
ncbi:hypothetical protein ACOBR2_04645 [Telmatobacter bradus]|uniref:hypothetical protein n=1 Tax=Telmatobacter bradus TaxID=474953 RepID=UPI003B433EB6